ncbi:MAG: hypothetical protein A2V72_00715 [Candidatus Nealsonbacteria bacterium RBG_13_37_56]|uniref:Uncharacterized protein n=1 Tax=Candidatus Nealsonbacteria bacterium RBG_13_37_56 TaxID=1801661 RepID=A0A1G2DWE8_9BACT|nr:MAG: hypothetical protein A2V72_00715 [Candidatus Nealsonbacteria bacterium RBG_13_37_56]
MEFSREKIIEYSKKYDLSKKETSDELTEKELREWFKKHRFLDKERLLKILNWKLAIKLPLKKAKEQNRNEHIQKITKIAFSFQIGEERIKLLLSPNIVGVGYPVASAILHFAFPNKYPILDFRVIWSLGWEQPRNYTFDFWQKYCRKLNKLAKQYKVSLRDLDKGLWYYSKENQK